MEETRKLFYKELKEAFDVYFNAGTSTFGQSESDCLMVIVTDHVEHYFPRLHEPSATNTSVSNPGITLVEGEGINVAYSYQDALNAELFKGLSADARIELLEACIYALNVRINNLEPGEDSEQE